MRVILYIIIVVSLFFLPVGRLDIARLEPVQTVAIRTEEESVLLETDTEHKGKGDTVAEALHDLKKNAPGVIYLDTAQYLLVAESAKGCVDELRQYLKPSVRVSLWDGKGSVANAEEYLAVENLIKLKNWEENA